MKRAVKQEAFSAATLAVIVRSEKLLAACRYLETGLVSETVLEQSKPFQTHLPAIYWWFRNARFRGAAKLLDLLWARGLVTWQTINHLDDLGETGLFWPHFVHAPAMARRFFEGGAHLVDWSVKSIREESRTIETIVERHVSSFDTGAGAGTLTRSQHLEFLDVLLAHAPDWMFTVGVFYDLIRRTGFHPLLERVYHRFAECPTTFPFHWDASQVQDARLWIEARRARAATALTNALALALPPVLLPIISLHLAEA